MSDLIDRQAAIEALQEHRNLFCDNTPETFSKLSYAEKSRVDELDMAIATLINLPSAQPETHEERTETHTCDYINRKDAIDAHYEYCNKHPDAGFPVWSLKILEDLPSADLSGYSDKLWKAAYERGRAEAQAEIVRCKDCKWFHDIGCAIRIVDDSDKPLENDYCSFAERRTDGV